MVYGYCRVSTDKQDEQRQVDELLEYGEQQGLDVAIVRERESAAKALPELEKLLERIGKGDLLVVTEFSRLTRRGIHELLEIARRVQRAGGSLLELSGGMKYDNSPMGELLVAFTATVDRMERERIGERTRSALAMRRKQGVKLGRPAGNSKLESKREEIDKLLELGVTKANIAKIVGCSRSTLYDYLGKRGG